MNPLFYTQPVPKFLIHLPHNMRSVLLLSIGLLAPITTFAQTTVDSCRQQVHSQSAIEHRLFRSTIFGEPEAEQARIGHVTFSTAGDSWVKTDDNTWESLAEGFETTSWSDAQIENQTAVPARQGILQTRRVATSDLVPPVVNNLRTFDCRLRTYCALVQQSALQSTDVTSFTIELPGCPRQELERIEACSPTTNAVEQNSISDVVNYCNSVSEDILNREKRLLAMSIEYDAAYRSTLQFAGSFDQFIAQLRFPLKNTIAQVVNVLGSLQRIPCFLSSCADYPIVSP